jgi:hypothetical protein
MRTGKKKIIIIIPDLKEHFATQSMLHLPQKHTDTYLH